MSPIIPQYTYEVITFMVYAPIIGIVLLIFLAPAIARNNLPARWWTDQDQATLRCNRVEPGPGYEQRKAECIRKVRRTSELSRPHSSTMAD